MLFDHCKNIDSFFFPGKDIFGFNLPHLVTKFCFNLGFYSGLCFVKVISPLLYTKQTLPVRKTDFQGTVPGRDIFGKKIHFLNVRGNWSYNQNFTGSSVFLAQYIIKISSKRIQRFFLLIFYRVENYTKLRKKG